MHDPQFWPLALTAGRSQARRRAAGDKTPDCVYVGTPNDVVAKMLEMAKIQKDDVVYDPGCGDGRMVIAAAKKYGCHGVGFEIVPKLVAEGRQIAKKRKVDHLVSIEDKDIFTVDYSKATVISMYLLPEMIVKLRPALEKMKPGSRIVAHDYSIKGVEAGRHRGDDLQRGQREAHAVPLHAAAEETGRRVMPRRRD